MADPALHVLTPTATPAGALSHPLWQHPLGLLLESTGDGIFGVDLDGLCVFINRAGAQMLGYEPAQVLGRNMHALTHHSHADGSPYPDTDCPLFNAFRRGLPCRIDTEVFWRRDHTAFAVAYSSYPIVDGDEVRGAVITFVDITERKRAADALQKAKDELELRVAERTQALSDALGQLRELAAYSENVREDERTRIAREVHDELGSLLVALKMDVNWLDKRLGEEPQRDPDAAQAMRDRMRHKCQNMSRLIENAVDNVGRIITDLRPSILDHQGLWAALEWQAHEFAQAGELALDWDLQVAPVWSPPAQLPWRCSASFKRCSATWAATPVPPRWRSICGPMPNGSVSPCGTMGRAPPRRRSRRPTPMASWACGSGPAISVVRSRSQARSATGPCSG